MTALRAKVKRVFTSRKNEPVYPQVEMNACGEFPNSCRMLAGRRAGPQGENANVLQWAKSRTWRATGPAGGLPVDIAFFCCVRRPGGLTHIKSGVNVCAASARARPRPRGARAAR